MNARLQPVTGATSADAMLAWQPDWQAWPLNRAMRLKVVVVRDEAGVAWGLARDAADAMLREAVSRAVAAPVRWREVDEDTLALWLARGEQAFEARGTLLPIASAAEAGPGSTGQALSVDTISRESSPVVRLLDATLFDALKAQASDLHLESTSQGMVIRHRLDGVMVHVGDIGSREVAEQLVSRLKVMAELDIGERRLPQDGRFKLRVQQSASAGEAGVREVDFRVSIMPSSFGEDAVLRILDRSRLAAEQQALSLEGLGFEADDASVVRRLARKPYGMLLVTGPTGSGKTTTLYAIVQEINDGADKIITIEDPVEYLFTPDRAIVDQREVGADTRSFHRALKSVFREDVDVVLIGEMRDAETMATAVTAAETGHLIFSSLHTNSASQTIDRIIDSFPGAQQSQIRAQLSTTLVAIVSQRLIPRVQGGLIPAAEIMIANPAIRNLIREGKEHEIDFVIETSSDQGMVSLNRALVDLAKKNEITMDNAVAYSPNPQELATLMRR